ncbi:unnamed protein product, partial [Ectocarpus sp. 12 AP-2014]
DIIQRVVYGDDGSFSGSQLTDGTRAVHALLANTAQATSHIAILFISPHTRQKEGNGMPECGTFHKTKNKQGLLLKLFAACREKICWISFTDFQTTLIFSPSAMTVC